MDHLPLFLLAIMDFLQPLIDAGSSLYRGLESYTLWGNTGVDYVLIPIIFISAFIVSYIFKFILVKRLSDILPKTVSTLNNPVIEQFKGLINFTTVFFVALFLSTQHLNLNPGFQLFFDIVIFGALIWAIFRFATDLVDISIKYKRESTETDQTHILAFVKLVAKVAIASLLALWYLTLLNVNVTGLAAGLGIAGITIAFALQNIVSDLFAAVAIYLDRPFELGDYINVNGHVGSIERIGIRTTHIRSVDGPLIVMSNQNLTQADIVNYKKMNERRVQQTIGVGADTPVETLRELPDLMEQRIETIEDVRVDNVWLKELADYSWNYEIIYYVDDPGMPRYREVQQEINYRILELMEEKDVEIPFPIQEIMVNQKK